MASQKDNLFANPTTGLSSHNAINRLRSDLVAQSRQPLGISAETLGGAISNLQNYKPNIRSGATKREPAVDIGAEFKKIEEGIGLTPTLDPENGHTFDDGEGVNTDTPEGERIEAPEHPTFKAASEGMFGDFYRSLKDGTNEAVDDIQFATSVLNNDANTNILALEQKLRRYMKEGQNPKPQRWEEGPDRDPDGSINWTGHGKQLLTGKSRFIDADWWGNLLGNTAPSIIGGVSSAITAGGAALASVVGAPAAPVAAFAGGIAGTGTTAGLQAMGGTIKQAYIAYRLEGWSPTQAYHKAYDDAQTDGLKTGAIAGASWAIAPLRFTGRATQQAVGSTIAVTPKGAAHTAASKTYPLPKGKYRLTMAPTTNLREIGKGAMFQSALVQPTMEIMDTAGSNIIAQRGYDPKRNFTDGFLDAWVGSVFMDAPTVAAGGLYTYARGRQKIIPALDDPNSPSTHKQMMQAVNAATKAAFLEGRGGEGNTTGTALTLWQPYNVKQTEDGKWQVTDQINADWVGPSFATEEEARQEQQKRNDVDAAAQTSGLNVESVQARYNFLDWQIRRLQEYDARQRAADPEYRGSQEVWRAVRFFEYMKAAQQDLETLLDPIERIERKKRGKKGQPPTIEIEEREKTLSERNDPRVLSQIEALQNIVDHVKMMMNPSITTKNDYWVFVDNDGNYFKVLTDGKGNVARPKDKNKKARPNWVSILDPRSGKKKRDVAEKTGTLENLGQVQNTNALMQGEVYASLMDIVEQFEAQDVYDVPFRESGKIETAPAQEEAPVDTEDTQGQDTQASLSPEEEFGGEGEPTVEAQVIPPTTPTSGAGIDGILQHFSGVDQENVRIILEMYMKSIGRNLDKVDIQSFAEYMNKLSPRQRRDVEAGRILGVFEDLSTVTSDTFERGIMALRSGHTTKAGELLRTVTHELVHLAVAVKRIDPQAFANFWNSKDADAVKVNGVSKRSIIAGYASRDDNNNLIYDEEGNLQYDMDESGLGEELVAEILAEMVTGRYKGKLPNEGNFKYIIRQFVRMVREFFERRRDGNLVNDYLENFRTKYYFDTNPSNPFTQGPKAHRVIRPMNEHSLAREQARLQEIFPGISAAEYPAGVYLPMNEGPKEPFNDKVMGGVTLIGVNNKIGERWIPNMRVGVGVDDSVSEVSQSEWNTIIAEQEWVPVGPRVYNRGKSTQYTVPAGRKLQNPEARIVNLVNPHPNGARRNWKWVKKVGNKWVPDVKMNKDGPIHLVSIQSTTNPGPDAGGFRSGNPDGFFSVSGDHVFALNYEAHTPVKMTVFDEAPSAPRLRPTTFASKLTPSKKIVGYALWSTGKEPRPIYETVSLTNKGQSKMKFRKAELPEGQVLDPIETTDPRFHRAWHGTGAEELIGDKLQLKFIGDVRFGEGGQFFGWGLYFADKMQVAKSYRDGHRVRSFSYKGQQISKESHAELVDLFGGATEEAVLNIEAKKHILQDLAKSELKDLPEAGIPEMGIEPVTHAQYKRSVYQNHLKRAKEDLADALLYLKDTQEIQEITLPDGSVEQTQSVADENAQQRYDQTEELVNWLQALKLDDVSISRGSVFEVDLAPELSEYLNFNVPLSQQSAEVQAKIHPFVQALQQYHDFKAKTSTGREADMHRNFSYADETMGETFYRDLAALSEGPTYWDHKSFESSMRSNTTYNSDFHDFAADNMILSAMKGRISELAQPNILDDKPVNPDRGVSLYLNEVGIPGNRFIDGTSRNARIDPREADYNYVIFDEDLIEIQQRAFRRIPPEELIVRKKEAGKPQTTVGGLMYGLLPSVIHGRSQWKEVTSRPATVFGDKNDPKKINVERIWEDVISEYSQDDNGDILIDLIRQKYGSDVIPHGNEFWVRSLSLPDRARYWYELSSEKFRQAFGSHGDDYLRMVVDVVAATSPQANPVDNMLRTIALLSEDMQGLPINTDLTSIKAVTDALNPDEYLRSDKIGNFSSTFSYLMGVLDRVPQSTNDRQVAAYFNMTADAISSQPVTAIVEKGTKNLAVDGAGNLLTKVTEQDGLETVSLPSIYDMISTFHIKLRNELNDKLPRRRIKTDKHNQEIEPFEAWQLQALGWVQQRIDTKGLGSTNDDYAQVIDQVIRDLKDKNIIPEDTDALTHDVLHNSKVPYELRGTLEPYMNTHMTSVPIREKWEQLNRKTNTVMDQQVVLRDLLREHPELKAPIKTLETMDKQMIDALSKRVGKIRIDGELKLPPMPSKASDKSLISQLASAIADKSLDFTRVTRGDKIANDSSRPTIRIPTHILDENQREVFLSYLARLLGHDEMVAHQFRPKEDAVVSAVRDGYVETVRVFVKTKTEGVVGTNEGIQLSNALDRQVEAYPSANGYVFDIVPDMNNPLMDQDIQDATQFLDSYGDVSLIAVDYTSVRVTDAAKKTAIEGGRDPDAQSQQQVIQGLKHGITTNAVREVATKHPQLSRREIRQFVRNDLPVFIDQSTGKAYSKAIQETVEGARNTVRRRLNDLAFIEARFEKRLARDLEKREAWNNKYGDSIAKAAGLEEFAPKFHRRPIALVPEMQGEALTSVQAPPEVQEEVQKYLRNYGSLSDDNKRAFLNRFVRNSVVGAFTSSAKRIFQIGRRTDAAMRLANWIDRDKYAHTGIGKTGFIEEDVHGQIQEVIGRYNVQYSASLSGLTRRQILEIPHIMRGKYKDPKTGRTNLAQIEGGFPVENAIAIRNIFNGLYAELQQVYIDQGLVPPPELKNYFPQKYDVEIGEYKDTGLSKQDALTEFFRVVMEPNKPTGRQKDRARQQAEIAVSKIVGEGFQPTWGFDFGEFAYDKNYKMEPQELRRLINVDPYKTFSVTLADGRVVPMRLVDFLSNDTGMVINNYITTTSRRTVFARRFGIRGQFVKDIVDLYKRDRKGNILLDANGNKVLGDIDQELKNRGEPLLSVDERKDLYELVRLNMGLQNRISHKWQGYTHALRFWGNVTLLSLATVQSLAEPILIGSRLGLWPMLNGIGYSTRAILRSPFVAAKAGGKALSSSARGNRWRTFMDAYGFDVLDAKQAAKDMGIIFESMQYVLQNSAESASHVKWERWNNRFFRSILLQPLTEMQQAAAFTASIRALSHWAKMAHKGKDKYKRYLQEVGLRPEDLAGFDINDPVGSANIKVRGALRQLNSEIIMSPDPGRKPGWMSDPRFALVAHIKSWIFTFNNTVLQRSMRTLIKDKNPMPLVYLVGFGLANAMLFEWREWLRYGEEGNPYMARIGLGKDNPMRTAYLAMERGGLFGPAQYGVDLVLGTRIATGYSLASTLVPTLNIVDRGLGGIGAFVEAPFAEVPERSIRKGLNELTRAIPLINTMGETRIDAINRISGYTPGRKRKGTKRKKTKRWQSR